jgi:hypothetical protein
VDVTRITLHPPSEKCVVSCLSPGVVSRLSPVASDLQAEVADAIRVVDARFADHEDQPQNMLNATPQMREVERRELPSTKVAIRRTRSDVLKPFMHAIMHDQLKHVWESFLIAGWTKTRGLCLPRTFWNGFPVPIARDRHAPCVTSSEKKPRHLSIRADALADGSVSQAFVRLSIFPSYLTSLPTQPP